jgi:hypothetical protein
MLIGLSLSFCVADIINGRVDIDDVSFIISGTHIRNAEELSDVLDTYTRYYWKDLPQLGRFVATRLYEEGKIIQPRLLGYGVPNTAEGWWAKVENYNSNKIYP